MRPSLCSVCQRFPWGLLDRRREFRYAWWKIDSLQVPEDEFPESYRIQITDVSNRPSKDDSEDDERLADEFCYHANIDDVRTASVNGCHICRLVLKAFSEYSMDGVGPRRQEDAVDSYRANRCRIRIVHEPSSGILKFHFDTESTLRTVALRYSFVSPDARDIREAFRPKLSCSAASIYTFAIINYWFGKCQRLHNDCAQVETPELPSRVIDVSSSAPFLHVSTVANNGRQRARYTALSHRWGIGKICMTKKGTVNGYCHALPLDELSKVFLDAIEVIRRLGIVYLWIDSLCIIQDSSEDWEAESGKMADIYTNAFCTIAAALLGDEDAGLFTPRDGLLRRPCRIELRRPPDRDSDPPGRGETGSTVECETVRFWNETDLAPLNLAHLYPLYTRAWVFQEQTLSPRILHFTPAGVHWECLVSSYAESEPLRQRQWKDAPVKISLRRQQRDPSELDSSHESQEPADVAAAHGQWLKLVETYSGRDITFDADRLPAMSGIAKTYKRWMEKCSTSYEDYLGGLWRENIFPSLTWYADVSRLRGEKKRHGRPSTYVAPSWSWAAVSGPVSFLVRYRNSGWRYSTSLTSEIRWEGETEPLCTLLDARSVSQNAALDPTGRIRSGRIVLLGPVCESPFVFNHLLKATTADMISDDVGSFWVRRDDATNTPVVKTKSLELDVLPADVGQTPATHSILLQLYPEFALILEQVGGVGGDGGFNYWRRIGWCVVGGGFNSNPPLVIPALFQREKIVAII